MVDRKTDKVERISLLESYKTNMLNHLLSTENITVEEAKRFVDQIVSAQFKDPLVDIIETTSYGNTRTATYPLSRIVAKANPNIISPSGSIYTPTSKKESILSLQVRDGLKHRKALKKKMLAAAAAGNEEERRIYNYAQASVKIRLNSLPGGLGSPYNIFYDKGSYNAITSAARSLIAQAYTTAEELLSGNWPLFTEAEVLNLIYSCKAKGPAKERIVAVMRKHSMRYMSQDDLYQFYLRTVRQYQPSAELATVKQVITTLEEHQIQFLYYMNNLKHIMWGNEPVFKTIIRSILDNSVSDGWQNLQPSDLWKLDSDLLAVVFTVMADHIAGIKIGDLESKHPDVARKCAYVGQRMQSHLDHIEDVLNTFVYHDICSQSILTRRTMYRNTVIISDTDSVIYTTKNWVVWYVGHVDSIVQESYNIAALATYWLTKAVADTLCKFSISHGATDDNTKIMQMKNEFLYPVLILFDLKKVYAGIVKVQEGVILPKIKPDIKGASIRSSTVAKTSRDFTTNMIVNDILLASTLGSISAAVLIQKVIAKEKEIIRSLDNGETEYLARQSVQSADSYTNPESCAYEYVVAWNDVFGHKYEIVRPPDKVPVIKLKDIDPIYLSWLREHDRDIHGRLLKYLDNKKGGAPSAIIIPNACKTVPIELLKIMDMRHIVYQNLQPVYFTLERLGICVGFEKHKLIFSDVYSDISI